MYTYRYSLTETVDLEDEAVLAREHVAADSGPFGLAQLAQQHLMHGYLVESQQYVPLYIL